MTLGRKPQGRTVPQTGHAKRGGDEMGRRGRVSWLRREVGWGAVGLKRASDVDADLVAGALIELDRSAGKVQATHQHLAHRADL